MTLTACVRSISLHLSNYLINVYDSCIWEYSNSWIIILCVCLSVCLGLDSGRVKHPASLLGHIHFLLQPGWLRHHGLPYKRALWCHTVRERLSSVEGVTGVTLKNLSTHIHTFKYDYFLYSGSLCLSSSIHLPFCCLSPFFLHSLCLSSGLVHSALTLTLHLLSFPDLFLWLLFLIFFSNPLV